LCDLLVAEATRRTRAQNVTLRVYRDNATALSVYTSLGFEVSDSESAGEILVMRKASRPVPGGHGGGPGQSIS
jgi:hypothetical protein